MEEGDEKHNETECCRDKYGDSKPTLCTLIFTGTMVLGDISAHRLHKCCRYEHDKTTDFFSDAYPGRRNQPQCVDYSEYNEKRQTYQ